jgi:chromate transporter
VSALSEGRRLPPGAIFLCFMSMSLRGFGGVLPWARRALVEEKQWLDETQFVSLLSLCQILPGPNIGNLSIYVGSRLGGPLGAVAAISGIMGPPMLIIMGLGALYGAYGELPLVSAAIGGVASVAAGLIVTMGLRMVRAVVRDVRTALFVAAAFVAVGPLQVPMVTVLLILAPVSVVIAFWMQRRGAA